MLVLRGSRERKDGLRLIGKQESDCVADTTDVHHGDGELAGAGIKSRAGQIRGIDWGRTRQPESDLRRFALQVHTNQIGLSLHDNRRNSQHIAGEAGGLRARFRLRVGCCVR